MIEFDKAIALGRSLNRTATPRKKTLVLVTADHDQSMSIIGVTDSPNTNGVLNTRSNSLYPRTIAAFDPRIGSGPAPNNGGSNVGEVTGFPDYTDHTFSGGDYPDNTTASSSRSVSEPGITPAPRSRLPPTVRARCSSAAISTRPTSSLTWRGS